MSDLCCLEVPRSIIRSNVHGNHIPKKKNEIAKKNTQGICYVQENNVRLGIYEGFSITDETAFITY